MIDGGRGIHFLHSMRSNFSCVNLVRPFNSSDGEKKETPSPALPTCASPAWRSNIHTLTYTYISPLENQMPKASCDTRVGGACGDCRHEKRECKGEKWGSHRPGRGPKILKHLNKNGTKASFQTVLSPDTLLPNPSYR